MRQEKNVIREPEGIAARVEDVRERVRNMINQGELLPGARINEQALALQLGIGRAATREALRSLEQAGLVQIIPNRGAEVRRLSLEDALHLYDVRAGLARTSGRLIALRVTADDELQLNALLDEMNVAVNERDEKKYYAINEVFHQELMRITRNPRLIALNESVENELKLYLRKGVVTLAQIRLSQSEHRKIIEAITSGQPELAAEAFERHVLTGKQRMLNTLGNEIQHPHQATPQDPAHV
jgi:DNA-binding GntR family transcriptional regulator